MVDPRRLVIQHALTARYLGVDFVPVYRNVTAAGQGGGNASPSGASILHNAGDAGASAGDGVAPLLRSPSYPPAGAGMKGELLDALRDRYTQDEPHSAFHTEYINLVFDDGDPDAQLMFVGEAPGAEEDQQGRPFVGRAGQLLDKMIAAMGLTRDGVYIANVLKTRPVNNATPTPEECALCAPYLFEQIRIVRPRAIVALGRPASLTLLGGDRPLGAMRGTWHEFPSDATPPEARPDIEPIPVMPTYHPAYVLRTYNTDSRTKVWSDLQQVMDLLGLERKRQ